MTDTQEGKLETIFQSSKDVVSLYDNVKGYIERLLSEKEKELRKEFKKEILLKFGDTRNGNPEEYGN